MAKAKKLQVGKNASKRKFNGKIYKLAQLKTKKRPYGSDMSARQIRNRGSFFVRVTKEGNRYAIWIRKK